MMKIKNSSWAPKLKGGFEPLTMQLTAAEIRYKLAVLYRKQEDLDDLIDDLEEQLDEYESQFA
jgi:hypothetical protein